MLKVIIILLIFSLFYLLSNKCIESFSNDDNYFKGFNTRLNYRNTGSYPWDRHYIYSSIPTDVEMKYNTTYYYEFGNDEYELRLRNIFKNNCKDLIVAVEGTDWSNWINPRCIISKDSACGGLNKDIVYDNYNKVFNYIASKINDSNDLMLPDDVLSKKKIKIQIVHDILKRYRLNNTQNDYMMIDIEMILYRQNKLHGKHVKFYAITNGDIVNIIVAKILGIVTEDNIGLHPVLPNDNVNDINNNFGIFIPEKNIALSYDREISDYNEIFESSEKLSESLLEEQLIDKLEANYNTELVDNKDVIYQFQPSQDINGDTYDIHMKKIDLKYAQQKEEEKRRENLNKMYEKEQLDMRNKFLGNLQRSDAEKNQYKLSTFENAIPKSYVLLK